MKPVLSLHRVSFLLFPLSCINPTFAQAAILSTDTPPLMLAKNFQQGIQLKNYLASEKLDGVRAFWDGKRLLSRAGNIINAPDWFTQSLPNVPLDGELWAGRNAFEQVSSTVRKLSPVDDEWQKIKYIVFDLPKDLSTFSLRYEKLKAYRQNSRQNNWRVLEQKQFNSEEELNLWYKQILAKKGEGLMLHRKDSLYQAARSNDLQKLKPFDDAEAIVTSHIPGKGKYQGLLGAIEVCNNEGVSFKIGSGFSLHQRRNPPEIGSQITYRYRGKTKYNTPRFATFLRQRDEE